MGKDKPKDPVAIRLDAMIRLLADNLVIEHNFNKNSIYASLNDIGLTPTEIGNIFGTEAKNIGSAITKSKKIRSKKLVKK